MKILIVLCIVVWVYLLTVFERAKLSFFKFLWGSVGMFLIMMVTLQPVITGPLQRAVAVQTGVLGDLTGMFRTYSQYALLFIKSSKGAISLYIDYECSGVIEILAFISLLSFFPVYNVAEKIVTGFIGIVWIFFSNILRLFLICLLIYCFGNNIYYFAHAVFGRIVFYVLMIALYFNVFTRSQILRQKVGKFSYEDNNV